jgi:replicative DNA helicase
LTKEGDADKVIEQAENTIFKLAQSARRKGDWISMADAVTEAHKQITDAYESGRRVTGLETGHVLIDKLLSGLQPGNLVVVAARPSMGKSAFALGTLLEVAVYGPKLPVGIINLEMSASELTQRMISMLSFVDATEIRNGRLSGEQWKSIMNASERLHAAPIYIDTAATTMIEVRAKARALKVRHPDLAMVVIDYLQLLSYGEGRYEGRVQDVSQISRSLKMLAGELEIPVVALSQLSRGVEQRHDKRPMLQDLRESGAIEQDADVVLFLYRDEYYNPEDTDQQGIAEIHVAKQRNGPTGTVKLAWVSRYARFGDLPPD